MAITVLTNSRLVFGGLNLTDYTNEWTAEFEAEIKDGTTYGLDGWRGMYKGIRTSTVNVAGFTDMADDGVDEVIHGTMVGTTAVPFSVVPVGGGALGDTSYSVELQHISRSVFGEVGELDPFSIGGRQYRSRPVRGTVLHPYASVVSSDGATTGLELGALSSTQSLHVYIHVFVASGTSVSVQIESDTAGFGSATSRATSATYTAVGSERITIAGAITDTWWRPVFDVTGTSAWRVLICAGIV